jgi:hypothetical protein
MSCLATTAICGLGFLLGLFAFRVKARWCPKCGSVKSCPVCTGWAASSIRQTNSTGHRWSCEQSSCGERGHAAEAAGKERQI